MEPFYAQTFQINDSAVDRYGRLKPAMILFYVQEVAGRHCTMLSVDYDSMAQRRLFWAVTRHRVQITRLPMSGETIRVETWPMPTTRVAYPRSVVAYDEKGEEVFRAISLWVLMDLDKRTMVLPAKSGVTVEGTLRGSELAVPGSLAPRPLGCTRSRSVCFTDLDRNGHMNNTRYCDWIQDLLPSDFHREHPVREFTICYTLEARENDLLDLHYEVLEPNIIRVEGWRRDAGQESHRIFVAEMIT